MSFASWYSIYKNLPDAEVALLCARGIRDSQCHFNWPYRCGIHFFQHENVGTKYGWPPLNKPYAACVALKQDLIRSPFLVIEPGTMMLRSFTQDVLEQLNDPDITFGECGPTCYFKDVGPERFAKALNSYEMFEDEDTDEHRMKAMMEVGIGKPEPITNLCHAAENSEIGALSYCNECGRYDKEKWTRSKKLHSPFPYASELCKNMTLTADQHQIMKLWDQMQFIYEMVK